MALVVCVCVYLHARIHSFGHFHRQYPTFSDFARRVQQKQDMCWGLLELELCRPDTDRAMLCLLASAYAASGAELATRGVEHLVTVIALKAALCRVLRELAQRASAASAAWRRLKAEFARDSSATEAPLCTQLWHSQNVRVAALESAQRRRRQVRCACNNIDIGLIHVRSTMKNLSVSHDRNSWPLNAP